MLSRAGRKPKGETMTLLVRGFPTELNEALKAAIRKYAPGKKKEEVIVQALRQWIEGEIPT